ncbi:uncharacterized protein LOC113215578 [Frankliniella occidentalis]|uniref:Uncharacterized protein LOC113215578 n=1 Tax=Frankliniella occidentalis TaxID=133901 RepID=A0A9C6X369_FRAOC|nr:uncharacterized protein LOC113215578 [Frankliniella occidentalis]
MSDNSDGKQNGDQEATDAKNFEPSNDKFWDALSKKVGVTMPSLLKLVLEKLGCDSESALRDIQKNRIKEMEVFVQEKLGKRMSPEVRKKYLGMFHEDYSDFEFLPGHASILLDIGQKLKDVEGKIFVRSPRQNVSPKPRTVRADSSGVDADDGLIEDTRILTTIISSELTRSYNLTSDAPLFLVNLSSTYSGTVLCQIGPCKARNHKQVISRSKTRPWSTYNFYRHVRSEHTQTDPPPKKQLRMTESEENSETLDDPGINADNNNNNAAGHSQYSRSEKRKRMLTVAALGCNRLTDYWPILNEIERVVKENNSLHSQIRTLMSRITENGDKPAEISHFLQALNASAQKNAQRKKGGERYDNEINLFATHFFMLAGPKVYADLEGNLPKALPSISTCQRTIKLNKQDLIDGQYRWRELSNFLEERGYPREVIVQEDATRCVAGVQYNSSNNQMVGFRVPLSVTGLPAVAQFPADSEVVMRRHFEDAPLAKNVYCILAQPLVDKASSFILCCFGSDNKFTAVQVASRWHLEEKEAAKFNIVVKMRATDGDSRCLSAMQARLFKAVTNPLQWHFWFRADINEKNVCIQDPTHVATKLRNLLLRKHILPMGNFYVSVTHIEVLLKSVSKDHHMLVSGDINGSDRMNFRSAEKLFSQTVTDILESDIPDAIGTAVFLKMARFATESFLSKSLSPSERLRMLWTANFFNRGWRAWIKKTPQYNLKNNFLTSNCYLCMEINAHCFLILIRYYRDNVDQLEKGAFAPWMWGSQKCESTFRHLRSMGTTQSTVINFTVLECLQKLARVRLEEDIRNELSSKYFFKSSRRTGKKHEGEILSELCNFPNDSEILNIVVRESRKSAQKQLNDLGMCIDIPVVFSSLKESEFEADDDYQVHIKIQL